MVTLTTADPALEANEPEIGLNASDVAHLRRALLWLLILFAVVAVTSLIINEPTPLFAGMQCYLFWCTISALIQYFFLRIEGSDLTDRQYNRAVAKQRLKPNAIGRSDPLIASRPGLLSFARTGQWVIFFVGLLVMTMFFRVTIGAAGLSRDAAVSLRVATVIFLAAGCAFYFFGNFAKAVAARIGSDALSPILTLARIASLAAFAAAGSIFLFLSTTRDYSVGSAGF